MENKNTSVLYNGLVWGLISAFIGIIISVILYMLDMGLEPWAQWLSIAVSIAIMVWAVITYRTVVDDVLPFGKAFGFLMVVVVVSAILASIYYYIFITVIDPGIIDKMMEMQMEKMVEKGVPEEAMDQAMSMTAKFMKPGIQVLFSIGGQLFLGTIISLIVAAIFKRDAGNEDPIVEEDTPAATE